MHAKSFVAATLGSLLAVSLVWSQYRPYSLAHLPGDPVDVAALLEIRASEQKQYKQCRSKNTTCSYTNTCAIDPDNGGCLNTDGCPGCSGGTNAGCTGPLETTVCVDDTLACCYLGKSCELRSTGCTCTQQGSVMVGTLQFCGG